MALRKCTSGRDNSLFLFRIIRINKLNPRKYSEGIYVMLFPVRIRIVSVFAKGWIGGAFANWQYAIWSSDRLLRPSNALIWISRIGLSRIYIFWSRTKFAVHCYILIFLILDTGSVPAWLWHRFPKVLALALALPLALALSHTHTCQIVNSISPFNYVKYGLYKCLRIFFNYNV